MTGQTRITPDLMQDPHKNPPANPLDPDWCNQVHSFMEWLYASSGRTCGTYTGLYEIYLETEKAQSLPGMEAELEN